MQTTNELDFFNQNSIQALEGDIDAQFRLALMYEDGKGTN